MKKEISEKALALRNSVSMLDISQAYGPNLQTELADIHDLSVLHFGVDVPTLKIVEQAFGSKYASRVWIKTQLVIVNDFCGTKEKLNDMQLDTLADQILVGYAGLNLFEFCCFCSRLRSGKYSKFYSSVDATLVLSSLDEFIEDWRNDINTYARKKEKEQRDREFEEHQKKAITFEQWVKTIPEDQRDDVLARFHNRSPLLDEDKAGQRKKQRNAMTVQEIVDKHKP